jgi:hypothetical protein
MTNGARYILFLLLFVCSCHQLSTKMPEAQLSAAVSLIPDKSYDEIKDSIVKRGRGSPRSILICTSLLQRKVLEK